jgi:N-carbamoyl-L-amino-acid hydrolase
MMTLDHLNRAPPAEFVALLDGVYEHSPWVAEQACARRPPGGYRTLAQLKRALVEAVHAAGRDAQLALLRAHPELAGKAMVARTLTAASSQEQDQAGLAACTPAEFDRIQQLNAEYGARFGWPFILAVRGPRGSGLARAEIIASFERRLAESPAREFAECLRQVHRIAELRLAERCGARPVLGELVWDWAEALAVHSDPGWRERGQLSVSYLTPAHQACARELARWMREECGFDEVAIDAVGNVVGLYHAAPGADPGTRRLLTGSHYDTVRNGGKYDGRLGILVPMACVRELHRAGRRLPYAIEVVGFAEEEGQRYPATFLASSALAGDFDPHWLDQRDAHGVTMREAMRAAGLPGTMAAIAALKRDPARYLGFVEVHIEQGPVLAALDLPLGVVSAVNGSLRYRGEVVGVASHAGTTPMAQRRDAAVPVALLAAYLEQRAAAVPDVVGTIGQLEVPDGAVNVVPGRCRFSLDIRASSDAARDTCAGDVLAELDRLCRLRGLTHQVEPTLRAAAAPSDPAWQRRWAAAVAALGLPVHHLPSGAGHDAMKLHAVMPQAMLFVRGLDDGISHNPREAVSADDADLAVQALQQLLQSLAEELA